VYGLLAVGAMSVFLIHYAVSGQAVYGDGIGYFAHLHTWVIDRDFDHTNEYKHIYNHTNNNAQVPLVSPVVQIVATTKAGKAENHYSPGVALLLIPAYGVAHGLSLAAQSLGWPVSSTGYGDLYQILSGIAAVLYVVTALWLLEKIVLTFTGDASMSRLASLAIFLTTSLFYYGSYDVLNSHFASFFLIVYFFYLFIKKDRSVLSNFLLGMLAGLLITNRLQDGVVVIIWLLDFCKSLYSSREVKWKISLFNVVAFGVGACCMILPLLIHWSVTFTDLTQHTYLRGLLLTYGDQNFPNLLGSLFHPMTGLFFRAPLLLIAYLSFWWYLKKWSSWNITLLHLFFIIQYVIITLQGGWHAAAYGGRMYISSLVFFAVLIGKLLAVLKEKDIKYPIILISFFTILNMCSLVSFIVWEKGAESGRKGLETRTLERINSWLPHTFLPQQN
jgi:hypothetical protein